MSRRTRLDIPDVPLYIVQRGNNRQSIFFAEEDYGFYLKCLKEAAERHSCDVHAYVLMRNHVHLLVTPYTPSGALRLMQSVGRRYVQYVNYTYRRTGTLWDGRFKSSLVESEPYLLACYRYIEHNPVRARIVAGPGDYRWSSYGYHALGKSDTLIRDHPLFVALGRTEEQRRQAYQELFRHELEPAVLGQIREALKYGLVVGSEPFKKLIEKSLSRCVRTPVRGRPRKHAARQRSTSSDPRFVSQK